MASKQKAILIGISGVSSSGKTTLARLLRDVFTGVFILHEDDFYKTDADIPVNDKGVQDWDCLESINLLDFEKALDHIKSHGTLPDWLASKEDQNSVGDARVNGQRLVELKEEAQSSDLGPQRLPIAIIDGFLLYSEAMKSIRDLFDVKLFLKTDFKTAKTRREARTGYVTLETFWEDPPGYVDEVVWPNYAREHAFLFQDGNVEGVLKEELCQQLGITAMPKEAEGDMTACTVWAFEVIKNHLSQRSLG